MEATPPTGDSSAQQQQPMRDRLLDVRRKLDTVANENPAFGETLVQSLDVVRRALDEFSGDQGQGGLAISFNGGKDACVVLYLLLLVLAERDELDRLSKAAGAINRIPVVYFEKEEFPEIEEFMKDVSQTYGFEFQTYALSYKDGMQDLVDSADGIKGVIMGQRRGDPWTETMEWFTPSTPGWAEFTRVNPVLEWKFCDVWRFLRGSGLPYCVLYDQGYTSLGERGDTAKNDALRLPNGEYRPAFELAEEEEHLERSPRTSGIDGGRGDDGRQRVLSNGGGGGEALGSGEGEKREEEAGGGGYIVVPRLPKRFFPWDRKWGFFGGSNHGLVSKYSICFGSRSSSGGAQAEKGAGQPNGSSRFAGLEVEAAAAAASRGGDNGVRAQSGDCQVGAEVGTCLQPGTKERGASTGWVGGSVRWFPVTTVVMALVLAAVGGRRSASSKGGGESVAAEGVLSK